MFNPTQRGRILESHSRVASLQLPPRRLLEEESRASLESPKSLRISNHQNEAAPSSSRPASPPPSSTNSSSLSPSQPDPRLPNPQTEHNVVASVSDQVAECSLNVILVVKILMVLIVVTSVKRLTVGITAVLLLEYVGRRVVSVPWWNRGSRRFGSRMVKLLLKKFHAPRKKKR